MIEVLVDLFLTDCPFDLGIQETYILYSTIIASVYRK